MMDEYLYKKFEVSNDGKEWYLRILIHYFDNAEKPFECVLVEDLEKATEGLDVTEGEGYKRESWCFGKMAQKVIIPFSDTDEFWLELKNEKLTKTRNRKAYSVVGKSECNTLVYIKDEETDLVEKVSLTHLFEYFIFSTFGENVGMYSFYDPQDKRTSCFKGV